MKIDFTEFLEKMFGKGFVSKSDLVLKLRDYYFQHNEALIIINNLQAEIKQLRGEG